MSSPRLYESLFILHKCNSTINRLWNIIEENIIKSDKQNSLLLSYYLKLEVTSFLEEYNSGFAKYPESEYKKRIIEIRKINAPIIKRINKWSDLNLFRNNIIAHPWRKNNAFVVPEPYTYNVPRNSFEIKVLAKLINYLWDMIENEFANELQSVFPYIKSLQQPTLPKTDYSSINSDHLIMATEVADLCIKYSKKYHLKVYQFIFEG